MQGKLKKTDSAVKTSEAWWSFIFAEGSLGQTLFRGVWPVVGGIIGAALGAVTDWINDFGLAGWALASVVGVLCALAIVYGVENVRYARNRRTFSEQAPDLKQTDQITEHSIDADYVQAAIERALKEAQIEEFKTATAVALKNNSDTWLETSKSFETHAQAHRRDVIVNEMSEFALATAKNLEVLQTYSEKTRTDMREQIEWISQGFTAVGHWEWHQKEFPKVLENGKVLGEIANRKITDEMWSEWQNLDKFWRGQIGIWAKVANWYAPNSGDSVYEIPDNRFYGEWDIDEANFARADRVKRYKDAMIVLRNLKNIRAHVERAIKSSAFQGVGKKAIVGASPEGINQLPSFELLPPLNIET